MYIRAHIFTCMKYIMRMYVWIFILLYFNVFVVWANICSVVYAVAKQQKRINKHYAQ